MKQLAKLAQAIVHGPKLLILDEPTTPGPAGAAADDPPGQGRMKDSGEMHLVCARICCADVEENLPKKF